MMTGQLDDDITVFYIPEIKKQTSASRKGLAPVSDSAAVVRISGDVVGRRLEYTIVIALHRLI
jgi:hypothetical protein